ncbi:Ribosome-binding ATPase YchF [Buchnera aphidicola (Cinara piceae)]|uniref:Ribosome-binding ATPase YchF n=1 Tax=Buchnera aphidicola (Cinara piceae) TaxID=1660043 RepID=A0A803FTN7_9GAMM|nr:redox-regulated ATPase YchF [Buchnera aphidicola]VFP88122.1 Ribosome-binding ATPase YchF [Buchnera aphidicola (Cinara piceae)]
MVYKFGIIGLPNVGKSALFNKITKLNIPSKNFPFCTIDPNIGVVSVFDGRLKKIAYCVSSKNIVYSIVTLIDIAGLVKGASKGEGLGNKFLEKIRECNALIHVVRCFKNTNIIHIYNDINPIRDIDIINTELLLSDLDLCERIIKKGSLRQSANDRNQKVSLNLINRCIRQLQSGFALRDIIFSKDEWKKLKQYQFLTLKPVIYILNMESNIDIDFSLDNVFKNNNFNKSTVFSIILNENNNTKINNMNYELSKKNIFYIDFINCNTIIKKVCDALKLKMFFTAGPKEVRSWIFKKGETALQISKLIHTDFSKGFIRAQIISYDDLIKYCNISKIRKLGKIRSEGKKYIVQDGDIINFLFNI